MTQKRRIHNRRRGRKTRRGGGSPYPLSYYHPGSVPPTAAHVGTDRMLPHGQLVRPALHVSGGGRHHYPFKGGFVPSVMEGFVAATSKYATPLALMLMYRLLHRNPRSKQKKRTHTRKGKARRRE